jgi:hypothetical protein
MENNFDGYGIDNFGWDDENQVKCESCGWEGYLAECPVDELQDIHYCPNCHEYV